MGDSPAERFHPVRVVVARTGLSPDLLRVWERRYGAVTPRRTPGGHRHYSDTDIRRLRHMAQLTGAGRRIRALAGLSEGALAGLARELDPVTSSRTRAPQRPEVDLRTAMDAIARFDARELDALLRRSAARLGPDDVIDALVVPLLREIGDRWHRGELSPANEHLASAVVRSVLAWLKDREAPSARAPVIAVGTPPGQLHEIGALIAAATASVRNWRVVYLGPNLPTDEIARAAGRTGARAVALSLVYPPRQPALRAELRRLVQSLPRGVTLLLGGAAAPTYMPMGRRALLVPNIGALRDWLETHSS